MNNIKSTGPSWTNRLIGTANEAERIERIIGRYAYFVYTKNSILDTFPLVEIRQIGEILLGISLSNQVFPEPYSFGDLYLTEHPTLMKKFNACDFALQCRVLDVAEEYQKAKDLFACIAIDWNTGLRQLLSVSSDLQRLEIEAEGFLYDPLTKTMVDRLLEIPLTKLLDTAKHILQTKKNTKDIGLYTVRCSDAFFIDNLFSFPLDAKFSLASGNTLDEFGHKLPESITAV
jgi:hypothetical protein